MKRRRRGNGNFRVPIPGVRVEPETRRTIDGTLFAASGVLLLLSIFGLAGTGGNAMSRLFTWLLGWGYALLPVAFFVLSGIFFFSKRHNLYSPAIFGITLLIGSVLGITHTFGRDSGAVGSIFGAVSGLFGFWATLVVLGALGIVGLILTFNLGLRIKDGASKEGMQPVPVPQAPAAVSPPVLSPEESKKVERSESAFRKKVSQEVMVPSQLKAAGADWKFPPLSLLEKDSSQPTAGDVRTNAKIIQRTLENFGISVEMAEVHIGPTVAQYTLKPAQGVKLSKIVALQNDLSLALAVHPLRIEAPIPGKSLVGIEVPNRVVARVRLGSLFETPSFYAEHRALPFPLGRDVMGEAVFADLSRMPHLLVAGATGSGKSIFIHSLLMSLWYRHSPASLRVILIDPKRVELSQYHELPFLLTPVITEGKRAILALRWTINEMERRYGLLLQEKARDIFSYNEKLRVQDGSQALPFIVIVIDELADLMAAYGREIEGSIVRLAQMARATGIHLVVSTQRPSVEVITGLIKANITSRIAFQVASQVDSRTILDMAGAEKLLGSGDMLYLASDSPKPRRIQAPLVSEGEVKRVAEHLRKVASSPDVAAYSDVQVTLDEMKETPESGFGEADIGQFAFDDGDDLYSDAYRVVVEAKRASASLLQRRLKVGYARAARLLDLLEAKGVVGPVDGARPRKVYFGEDRE
ncbi:MAG: DNA translocase FtsK [Parcubacteria group bacterium]|nr:DNA translocase FtsK [Parcubacteria group bacterium]